MNIEITRDQVLEVVRQHPGAPSHVLGILWEQGGYAKQLSENPFDSTRISAERGVERQFGEHIRYLLWQRTVVWGDGNKLIINPGVDSLVSV